MEGITLIVGIRGSGKTTQGRTLLHQIAPARLLIVEGSGDWGDQVHKPLKTMPSAAKFYRTSHRIDFSQPEIIYKALCLIQARGGFYILLDDLDALLQTLSEKRRLQGLMMAKLNLMATLGRHKRIGMLAITHRLRGIPQNILSEASRLEMFSIHHDDDLRRLKTILSKEDVARVKEAQGHDFQTFNLWATSKSDG